MWWWWRGYNGCGWISRQTHPPPASGESRVLRRHDSSSTKNSKRKKYTRGEKRNKGAAGVRRSWSEGVVSGAAMDCSHAIRIRNDWVASRWWWLDHGQQQRRHAQFRVIKYNTPGVRTICLYCALLYNNPQEQRSDRLNVNSTTWEWRLSLCGWCRLDNLSEGWKSDYCSKFCSTRPLLLEEVRRVVTLSLPFPFYFFVVSLFFYCTWLRRYSAPLFGITCNHWR